MRLPSAAKPRCCCLVIVDGARRGASGASRRSALMLRCHNADSDVRTAQKYVMAGAVDPLIRSPVQEHTECAAR